MYIKKRLVKDLLTTHNKHQHITFSFCVRRQTKLIAVYRDDNPKRSQQITRNHLKTDSPSSPPQYFLSMLSTVPSMAFPTICKDSNLGLPDHQKEKYQDLEYRTTFRNSRENI